MKSVKEYVAIRKKKIIDIISSHKIDINFTIVQVNDDAGSNAYVKGKLKDAEELGIKAELIKLPIDTSEEELLELISSLNMNEKVDGFIVQMPLPKHINEDHIKLAISPNKDVDGFHPLSSLSPCTPSGIISYLEFNNYAFHGKNAVILGRSNIVGKPMSKLLLAKNMNVTTLHSKTTFEDMNFYIQHADLIVVAIGKPEFLDNRFTYNPNAIVIDVGINRLSTGLCGDAKNNLPILFKTPVPGGVGLLTRLALLENLLKIKGVK